MDIISEYGEAENFLKTFNPDMQAPYTRNETLCFATDKAPSLARVKHTYGEKTAETWLEVQLRDLSEFSGSKEKMSIRQLEQLSKVIIQNYGYLKVTELMVFFQRFKAGYYGKFYGSVDTMTITTAIREFMEYRAAKLNEIVQAKERAEREKIWREMESRKNQK